MRGTDYYKLLYQGVFGVGHIMGNGAWGWLTKEADGLDMDDQPDEPLVEAVSADGAMVRVNLRSYLRGGQTLESLFDAMKATALVEGPTDEFMEAWAAFLELVGEGRIEIAPSELEELEDELREKGAIPHHHSEEYREAYSPAYRVVKQGTLHQ